MVTMETNHVTRRHFLKLCGGALISMPMVSLVGCNQSNMGIAFASGYTNNLGQHFVAGFDQYGNVLAQYKLPNRGHGLCQVPAYPNQAIIFDRRPGTHIRQVDLTTGELIQQQLCNKQRRFYGHGSFNQGGSMLCTTENDFANGRGVITIRDGNTLQSVTEFSSYGIGPHECKVMPDNQTLVVANGGIKTHPSYPKQKLNVDNMLPNLSYIDIRSGKLIGQYNLPDKHMSIRHLDVSTSGQVVLAVQHQHGYSSTALIYSHNSQGLLKPFVADAQIWEQFNGYTASVAINNEQQQVAVSSPKGDMVSIWSLTTHKLVAQHVLKDCAGIAVTNGQFIFSTGKGELFRATLKQHPQVRRVSNVRWDNHMIAMT